jgi:hypothetical protein
MHPNYASSPQLSQPSNAPNVPVSTPQFSPQVLYSRLPPELRQQFDEGDNAKKSAILREFSKRVSPIFF